MTTKKLNKKKKKKENWFNLKDICKRKCNDLVFDGNKRFFTEFIREFNNI